MQQKKRGKREKKRVPGQNPIKLVADGKLTAEEKLRLRKSIRRAEKEGRIADSAQKTLPYEEIYPDGVCQVSARYFTKTVRFYDINYQLARTEDKQAIFENYCEFLNQFDSSVRVEFSFLNQKASPREFQEAVTIPERDDAFNSVRREYAAMLKSRLAKGNNGLIKTKYITFGIEADTLREARPKLERVETDIINHFKVLGASAYGLDGTERLELLFRGMHGYSGRKFHFAWDAVAGTGLNTKSFVAPDSFSFQTRTFTMGRMYGAASFIQISASELTDRILADLLDLDGNLSVAMHIRPVNQTEAIRMIKHKLTDIDSMKIQEQMRAFRSGYDLDIVPSDLNVYGKDARALLEDLQSRDERMFLTTLIVVNTAPTREALENSIFQAQGVVQKYNCELRRLDFQQEQGLVSTLPLGVNQIETERALTTSSTAIFVPFTTQELFMGGDALYYGLNALSSNLIMADRKKLKTPNGLILGTPGSGKSFSAKREITNTFLITGDDIIILDPENEYGPLTAALGGQSIEISTTSRQYVNPMDINMNYSEDDDPLALKSGFILSLCELVTASPGGLQPTEISVIDRCLPEVYRAYLRDPKPENMPVLGDLHRVLRDQPEAEAQRIATALEIYVTGSLNVFNHRTNIDLTNRLVCFNIKNLVGNQLKKLGMMIVQDQVWGRVTENRESRRTTWFYMDEFHLLLKDEQTAAYSVEIWKRFRKWGGIPTGITQNCKDLLASSEIVDIFDNSNFILLLNQAPFDREILARHLSISQLQLSYVTNSQEGEGLLVYGGVIIPFLDHFPKETKLYRIMTTKPEECGCEKRA